MRNHIRLSLASLILAATAGAGIAQESGRPKSDVLQGLEVSEGARLEIARNMLREATRRDDMSYGTRLKEAGTLSVSVTETYSLDNDHAEISFGMVTEGKDPAAVMAENNKKMTAIIEGLGDIGIPESDVTTSGINLQPVFTGGPVATGEGVRDGEIRISGYRMDNAIRVKVSDLAVVGDVVAGAIRSGANSVNGFSMGATPDPEKMRELRDQAIAKAGEEAKDIAEAAGSRIVGIASIQVQEGSIDIPQPMMRMMAAETGSVPVSSGQSESQVTVFATYKIILKELDLQTMIDEMKKMDNWKGQDKKRRESDVMIDKTSAEE